MFNLIMWTWVVLSILTFLGIWPIDKHLFKQMTLFLVCFGIASMLVVSKIILGL